MIGNIMCCNILWMAYLFISIYIQLQCSFTRVYCLSTKRKAGTYTMLINVVHLSDLLHNLTIWSYCIQASSAHKCCSFHWCMHKFTSFVHNYRYDSCWTRVARFLWDCYHNHFMAFWLSLSVKSKLHILHWLVVNWRVCWLFNAAFFPVLYYFIWLHHLVIVVTCTLFPDRDKFEIFRENLVLENS